MEKQTTLDTKILVSDKIALLRDNIRFVRRNEIKLIGSKKQSMDFAGYVYGYDIDCRYRNEGSRVSDFGGDLDWAYSHVYKGYAESTLSLPTTNCIAMPYSVLKRLIPFDTTKHTVDFGTFPQDESSNLNTEKGSIVPTSVVQKEYLINGNKFKSLWWEKNATVELYIPSPADIYDEFYMKNGRYFVRPICWDIYPDRDLALCKNVLFDRKRNDKDYLRNTFVDSILDKNTLQSMGSSDNKITISNLIFEIYYYCDEYELKEFRELTEKEVLKYQNSNKAAIVPTDENFIFQLTTILDSVKAQVIRYIMKPESLFKRRLKTLKTIFEGRKY